MGNVGCFNFYQGNIKFQKLILIRNYFKEIVGDKDG